jgi:outer membrane biosynthesis protein TonB
MATHRHEFAQQKLHGERRANLRVVPALLTYVSFGGSNGGMVLDVSEGGLAVATAFAIPNASPLNITIPADPTHGLIEVTARVAWIAESKRHLGVQLIGASPSTQEFMRSWISAVQASRGDARASLDNLGTKEESAVADVATVHVTRSAATQVFATQPPAAQPLANGTEALESGLFEWLQSRARVVVMGGSGDAASLTAPLAKAAETTPEKPICHVTALQWEISEFSSRVVDSTPTNATPPGNVHAHEPKTAPAAEGRSSSWIARSRSVPMAATLAVVIGGFASGIAIGRSVVAHWNHGSTATRVAASHDTDVPGSVIPFEMAATTAPPTSSNAGPAAVAVPSTPAALLPWGASARNENSSGYLADPAIPGGEILITPKEGDAPLRVDLGEEVIAHSPSLEIRSRRLAFVPGAAPSGHHKPRKERLEVGILISRVTPQLPAAALGASGSRNGEETVAVRATISGDGHIVNVDPLSGPNTLMPRVMGAVREWRYDPSSLNGKPIETQVDLTLKFHPLR